MEYCGNYKEWLQQSWIDELKESSGIKMPRDFMKYEHRYNDLKEDRELSQEEIDHKNAGYSDSVHFEMFDPADVSFDLDIPFIKDQENYCWWIVKLLPGQITPSHIDKDNPDMKINKFWMPWSDWEPGQAFLYGKEAITDWKAGDVWRFTDPGITHSAVNAGLNIRIALQITNFRPARSKE